MRVPTVLIALVLSSAGCSKKAADSGGKQPPPATADKVADKPVAPPEKPPEKPPAASKGGCSYITEAEATAALGQPSKYRSNDGGSNCVIDPVAEASATTTMVDFTVKIGDEGSYTSLAKNAKKLDGVGDKAVIDGAGGMAQIAVVKGTATLLMTIAGPKSADPTVIKAFADKVFTHI